MNLPSAMVLFARVVDAGSFTAASRALNQSPSAVSKQIAHLEDHVGVRLLQRLKTGVVLTEDGEEFYRHCVEIRKRVEAAEELVMSFGSGPAGLGSPSRSSINRSMPERLPITAGCFVRRQSISRVTARQARHLTLRRIIV